MTMPEATNTVFVLGNGPSLRGVPLPEFSGVDTIGMNAAYRLWERIGWYPTHYCCLDDELLATHHEAIRSLLRDDLVQSAFVTARILDFHPDLAEDSRCVFLDSFIEHWHERRGRQRGLPFLREPAFQSSAPSKLTTGSHAVRYAIHLGYTKLYLIGIDCNYVELIEGARHRDGIALEIEHTPERNPNYFFDDYQRSGDRYNEPNPAAHGGNLHLQAMEALRDDVVAQGLKVEIRNCAVRSKLTSRGVFAYEELDRAMRKPLLGGVAVPMTFSEESALAANLRRWSMPAYQPLAHAGYPVPLVAVLNGTRDRAFEERMLAVFSDCPRLAPSFSSLEFEYCELSEAEDRYEQDYTKPAGPNGYKPGPNNQFFRAMELLRPYGRYVFMMENDCLPIRPNWLGELQRILEGGESLWVLGSLYRGVGPLDERWRVHLNGNAVYAVGDEEFQQFLREVWRPALSRLLPDVPTLAYDCVLPLHFTNGAAAPANESWELYQRVAHRFRATDYIQNHAGKAETERGEGATLEAIRASSPSTYVVHGRHLFPDDGAPVLSSAPRALAAEGPSPPSEPEGVNAIATKLDELLGEQKRTASELLSRMRELETDPDRRGVAEGNR